VDRMRDLARVEPWREWWRRFGVDRRGAAQCWTVVLACSPGAFPDDGSSVRRESSSMAASERVDDVVSGGGSAVSAAHGPVLECRELRKRFGDVEAVRGVSFQIAEGETYGLLGPNGAGKTTTISMVCGLLEPDGGEVFVTGTPLTTHSVAAKAAIGYVPQELAIYPDLSAREPPFLRSPVRPTAGRCAGSGGRGSGGDRPCRPRRRADEELLGRDAAAAEHRYRAAPPPAAADPR
jgi:hypothetical protein